MPIVDEAKWKASEAKNEGDEYSKHIVDTAREVMAELDSRGDKPVEAKDTHGIVVEAGKKATGTDQSGLSGFQAGAVAHMVVTHHSRGKEFKDAWNEANGVKPTTRGGVANPALATIRSHQ